MRAKTRLILELFRADRPYITATHADLGRAGCFWRLDWRPWDDALASFRIRLVHSTLIPFYGQATVQASCVCATKPRKKAAQSAYEGAATAHDGHNYCSSLSLNRTL